MTDKIHELGVLLKSRFPVVVVETPEEPRFAQMAERVCNLEELALFTWSVANGIARHNRPNDTFSQTNDLLDAAKHIRLMKNNGVIVFFDAQPFLDNPIIVRLFREIALDYARIAKTLVFVGSRVNLPTDLQRMSASFRLELPGADEIRNVVREEIAFWKSANEGDVLKGDRGALNLMIQHLVGFTRDDARRLVRQAIERDGTIDREDVARILRHKHEALADSGVLTLEINTGSFDDIGGQAGLKSWLALRRPVILGEAGTERLDPPRGVLLLGVQGGGKSLAAKTIAGAWQLPLLRLDFGALYNKFHGETERNLRESLRTAQSMAPCILWMDEIEKGLASGSDSSDGGVSRRVLGAFLTWMSERHARVFLVATANDISRLPPELLRKGRFDEIFFVDLPEEGVRRDIFAIHLRKRGLDPAKFDLVQLAECAAGFSGAEIEQAVIAAQYAAFGATQTPDTAVLVAELRRTRPLSVLRAEEIADLRAWAAGRTVLAD